MITKHFLKTLFIFMCIIALTLLGVYIVGTLGKEEGSTNIPSSIFNLFEE